MLPCIHPANIYSRFDATVHLVTAVVSYSAFQSGHLAVLPSTSSTRGPARIFASQQCRSFTAVQVFHKERNASSGFGVALLSSFFANAARGGGGPDIRIRALPGERGGQQGPLRLLPGASADAAGGPAYTGAAAALQPASLCAHSRGLSSATLLRISTRPLLSA